MQIPYSLLENIIMIEVLIVVIIIFATFVLKYINYRGSKNNKRLEMQIEDYLREILSNYHHEVNIEVPSNWKRLDIILPLIIDLDTKLTDQNWPALKESFFKIAVLPLARKIAYSGRWISRLLAAQAFEIYMEEGDEAHVAHLIMDKVPIVRLQAITDAVKFSSEYMINLFITHMAQQRRLNQSVYLKIFEIAQKGVDQIIYARLQYEEDPYVRTCCYKLLLTLPRPNKEFDATADINSRVLELQLSAIRFTVHEYQEKTIPLLIDLLSDTNWQIRSTSLHLLSQLKAVQAISQIAECLKDPIWWVRLNAANTLKYFGAPGISILEAQDPTIDRYAFETAMHVLNKSIN